MNKPTKDEKLAARAYDKKALAEYGEFARLNFTPEMWEKMVLDVDFT